MKSPAWKAAAKSSSDPHRAAHFFELLGAADETLDLDNLTPDHARILAALFSGSQALANWLIAHPARVQALDPAVIGFPRRHQGLRAEVNAWFQPMLANRDYGLALTKLREFNRQELLRIAARDLGRLGQTLEIMQELSDVADVCLDSVWQLCHRQLVQRHGQPFHQDVDGAWRQTPGCVLGLGKLGGQELNYSSDVDVIFLYTEEGGTFLKRPALGKSPRPSLSNHQFFQRLAEAFVTEVTRMTTEGSLYRVDLRLRPEGDIGPLCRSLGSYETYYSQWGQTWERMMLIKARGVAGDPTLAAEFLEMIQPFRYSRSLNESVLAEVPAMKQRIENEVVKSGELERNVKLGRGGIREIEFTAQTLQMLHAGRQPFLQGAQTLPCLQKLVQYELLPRDDSRQLTEAYCFLRDLEHRLQMEDNRQTHTLPASPVALERLARLMGFARADALEKARQSHSDNVRRIFDKLLKVEDPAANGALRLPLQFDGAEEEWKKVLGAHNFTDPAKAFRVLKDFVQGPGYTHVSERTSRLAMGLLSKLFALCQGIHHNHKRPQPAAGRPPANVEPDVPKTRLSDPDRVLARLDSFISAYGARSTLFELWNTNPIIFELLVLLFDRSEFLAELAIRTPDLVDELVTSGRLRQRKTAAETLRDLRHGRADPDQRLWMRKYHQAELMRIGLRDILGLADFEQYLLELSALADACLQYALEIVMAAHRLKSTPFAIIGLGKLGGEEIDYGSDLDIIFVASSKAKDLSKLVPLSREVMDLVSTRTAQGMVFHTDARLRPDGDKGLLVNTLDHYEEYYRRRGQLWEIQTLTRTRPVAGDKKVAEQFLAMAGALTNFKKTSLPLAAFTPGWKQKIHQMRSRIEKERTPAGKDDLAIKTGAGGLMDAEFIAQRLCLENGWQEANTLRALQKGRDSGVLPDADSLIENYRRLRWLEGILRRWSYEGETVLPDDPAPYYRVSVRGGFQTPEAFRAALAQWRKAIRAVYSRVFST